MVAWLLRVVLLVLVALAAGWAAWWALRGQPIVAALGALALLLLHASVLAVEFVLVPIANRADPVPRASLRELAGAWWNESRLGLRVFAWQMPFRADAHPDLIPADASGRRGVLFVHGFMCNRGVWNTWLPRLRARGVPFIALSLEPAFCSIDAYVPAIDDAVRRMRDATGMAPVIVAHSMGGVAVRAWCAWYAHELETREQAHRQAVPKAGQPPGTRRGASRAVGAVSDASVGASTPDPVPRDAHTIVTIASPHQGTVFGHRGPMANVGQMRRGSPWLEALAPTELPSLRERFICFYSHCDNVVLPASTATLEGADNRHLRATAHMQLVEHPAVFAAVVEVLER